MCTETWRELALLRRLEWTHASGQEKARPTVEMARITFHVDVFIPQKKHGTYCSTQMIRTNNIFYPTRNGSIAGTEHEGTVQISAKSMTATSDNFQLVYLCSTE
jgi:hypothetical protein